MKRVTWENGVEETFIYDQLTNEFHIKRVQDVAPDLEMSKALANNEDATKKGIKDGMWYYGHIPNMILAQWMQQGVDVNDMKELFRMINKPEYKYLKTTTKYHS